MNCVLFPIRMKAGRLFKAAACIAGSPAGLSKGSNRLAFSAYHLIPGDCVFGNEQMPN